MNRASSISVFLGVALVTAVLAFDAALAYRNTRELHYNAFWVSHSNEALDALDELLSIAKDSETGQRGFLITGDEQYLEPYDNARRHVDVQLEKVKRLMQDNPREQARFPRLQELIRDKMEELARTIALRKGQGFEAAQREVLTHLGKNKMNALRAFIAEMEVDERGLLRERQEANDRAYRSALLSGAIAGIISIAAVLAFVGLLQRHLRAQTRAAAALHEQREWFRTTLGSIGDAVIATDAKGRITFINPEAQRLTAWKETEVLTQPLDDVFRIVNEETRETVESPVEKVIRKGIVVGLANHTILIAKDGSECPIDDSAAPIRKEDGTLIGVVLVFRDFTARRNAEEVNARLAAIVEYSGDAIFTKDLNGVIQTWNKSAERFFGYAAEEIIGKPITVLVPPERIAEENQILNRIRGGQPFEHLETVRVTKDGRRIPVSLNASPIKDREGRVVGASKILHDITDILAAREALIQERHLLATTLSSIGDAVITTDSFAVVTYLNPVAERLTGWRSQNAEGNPLVNVFRIVNEVTREPVENPAIRALKEGVIVGLANHTVLISKTGDECPIDDSAAPIRDEKDNIVGVVLVFRDITPRKREEAAGQKRIADLADAAERMRSVLDTVIDGIVTINQHCIVQSFNPAAERLFAYQRNEVIGHNVNMLMPDPYFTEHDGYIVNYTRTGEAKIIGIGREVVGQRKDGSTFPMDLAVSEFRIGHDRYFTGVVRDITERVRAEQALRESEQRFRRLADSAPVLIWISGTDKKCTWFNKVWLDFVGRPMEKEIGDGWAENVHPEDVDRCIQDYNSSFDARRPFLMEYRLKRHDGQYRWIWDSGTPNYDGNNTFIGYVGSCVDIQDRKAAEDALLDADRRKDEFIAILSHELRNPLAPIRMAVALLRKIGPPDPELKELREIIDRQANQMTRLLDDLLDVSRITSGKIVLRKEQVSLGVAVASAVESIQPLIHSHGHELTVKIPPDPIYVEGDLARLAQIFANLLNNATKYTERKGHISLTVERQGGDAIVNIRDTGIGIPADQLPRIFDMFVQVDKSLERSRGGLGIGLSLVQRLVDLHGGQIKAHSDGLGKGSKFTIRLPVVAEPALSSDAPAQASSDVPDITPYRILIADDNEDSATVLTRILRQRGHEVRTVHDGSEAIKIAESFVPQFAFLDIGMPRLNGYEVAGRLRSRFSGEIVLVAITGWGQDEDKQKAKEAGFDHHLTKPLDPSVLDTLLAEPVNK